MSLKLTGKGSILDAIGGGLSTAGNAVVAGVKDVGDVASAGLNELTGNSQGAQQSLHAIKTNDANLSGENLGSNISGLGSDIVQGGINPVVRPIVGLGVGLGEDLGGDTNNQDYSGLGGDLANYASDNNKIKNLGSPRQLLGNAIQTGVNVATLGKGSALEGGVEDVGKNLLGRASIEEGGEGLGREGLNAVGQNVLDNSVLARTANRVAGSAASGAIVGGSYGAGNAVANAQNAKQAISDIVTPAIQIGALGGGTGLATKVPDIASTVKENTVPLDEVGGINNRPVPYPKDLNVPDNAEDIVSQNNPMNPPTGTKEAETNATPENSPDQLAIATANVQSDLTQPIDWTKVNGATSELKSTKLDSASSEYQQLAKQAKAEQDVKAYLAADRASGFSKVKNKFELPKGAPAKKFVQALWDKTHSPEHAAAMDVGTQLGDVRTTLKGVKALRDQARKEYDAMLKTHPDEPTIRAKAAELNSLEGRFRNLKGQEQHYAMTYGNIRKQLDEKYPDINLTAKKGVRLTTNSSSFETAKPIKVPTKTSGGVEQESAAYKPETEPKPYTGPNLNEGAFSKEDQANLAAEQKIEDAKNETPTRNIEGDKAILDGIKNGDSDAALVRSYMDATGVDEETAKKAVGVLNTDEHVDNQGAVENNPKYGTTANYKIGKAEDIKQTGLDKVLVKTKSGAEKLQTNALLNKIVLKAHAPGLLAATKESLARDVFDKLTPEDQALADRLRNNDIDTLTKDAKDPELFKEYATRVKDLQDTAHADRPVADPFQEGNLYRRNYGAGFSLEDKDGHPTTVSQFEGKEQNFQKGRNFHTYKDIEEASGLKRSSANFHEDVQNDVASNNRFIIDHSIVRGIKDTFGKDAAYLKDDPDRPTDLKQLNAYKNVYIRPDLAERLNERASKPISTDLIGKATQKFDSLNATQKTLRLALGGFHNINIGISAGILNPGEFGKTIQAWNSDPFYKDQLDKAVNDGSLEKAYHGGLTLSSGSEFESKLASKIPGHDALFNRQIPMSKLAVFQKYTKGLNLNDNYDDIRGVARVTNNIFGGINRLVDGMNSTRLKQVGRFVLATDYNEGQIRALLTALSKGGIEGNIARRLIGGRMALLAAPGTIQGLVDGKAGKTPKQIATFIGKQLFDPTVQTPWKTAGGNPKQIALIATVTNKFYRAIAPAFEKNNPDKTSGLTQELSGNLSALASSVYSEYKNSDYYGNPLHGHGIGALGDVGNLLNQAAPIPAQPVGRALENIKGASNNPIIKIISGQQSAISPIEAGVDVSGIGRGQANPEAPEIQIMNNRQLLYEGLSKDDQGIIDKDVDPAWSGKNTPAQEAVVYNNKDYEVNKWTTLADNPAIYNAFKKQNAFAVAHGEPNNPLFTLSPNDQKIVTRYEQLKASDPGTGANNTAAVMFSQNKAMLTKFENDTQTYETKMNQLYKSSGGTKGSQAPQITPGGIAYPTINNQTQTALNQYEGMNPSNSTSQQRAQFLTDNPSVTQAFTAIDGYENARRAALNEPLLKNYPVASTALNNWITDYTNASKAERKVMSNDYTSSNYNAMGDYFAQVDAYELSKTAGQAQFQGQNLSQENLKDIYDLGQYDIAPPAGADGTYDLDPETAYNDFSSGSDSSSRGSSSKSSSSAENLINELIEEDHAKDIEHTVKYAAKPAKIRVKAGKRIYMKKTLPKKARLAPLPIKIKSKSVAIV